jgi:outer membrane lipoprotein-sorting protein
MGGNNWLKVESIRLNGTIERDGKIVDICIVKKRPNQIRATITLPLPGSEDEKLQVIRAHDGKTAWTATRLAGAPEMKREELPPDAAAELLADAGVLPPLIKLWREGATLKLLDAREGPDQNTFKVQARARNSMRSYTFYLDRETYRSVAFETQDRSGKTTRTTLNDYAFESGISLAKHNTIEAPDTGRSVMRIDSIEIGVGIYQEYFGIGTATATADSR